MGLFLTGGGFGGKKESGQLRFGGRDRPFKKPIVIKPLRTNNEEEDAHRFQGKDSRPAEEGGSEMEYSKDLRDSRFPRKGFNKPWDRSHPGSSREGRSWRDREEDGRYCNERDSRREKSRNYSKRDWNEREDHYGRSSWDRKEDRRYSDKPSRDREENRKFPRDRKEWEDPNKKDRRKSYWDQANMKLDENQGRSTKISDQNESRSDSYTKSSGRSQHREESSVKVKEEQLSPNDRDMGEWEDTPERDERRFKRSPEDREDEEGESAESKGRKRAKRSRDPSDSEDDGRERKSKKKKKRSKKSRDYEDSDGSCERRKEKKKKKHKKSRD